MKNKTLLIIFVILLGVYFLSKNISKKKERSFKTELIQIDTASITKVLVYPKADNFEEVTLKKENNAWFVSKGTKTYKAMQNTVTALLNQLVLIKTKHIAAKSPDKWQEFEVSDSLGSKIKVFAGGKMLEDFIVGRFSFNQQLRTATSYVRISGENEVYAVDGFLGMSLTQGFDSYRDKQILKLNKNDITKIELQKFNSEVIFAKENNLWTVNGAQVDSTKFDNYLTGLITISGTEFADDPDETTIDNYLVNKLTISGNNMIQPIEVKCFSDSTWTKPFIIHSSQNQSGWFESDTSGVFTRIFKNLEEYSPLMGQE